MNLNPAQPFLRLCDIEQAITLSEPVFILYKVGTVAMLSNKFVRFLPLKKV
jgi:hypothetical protein